MAKAPKPDADAPKAFPLTSDQFVALESWLEGMLMEDRCGPNGLHVRRQRAFAALTGIAAPVSASASMALADEAVERAQRHRKGPKPPAAAPSFDPEEFA